MNDCDFTDAVAAGLWPVDLDAAFTPIKAAHKGRGYSGYSRWKTPTELRYFFDLGDSTGLVAVPLVGWSIWNSFFSC
jgi:hypothetical protein